MNLPPLPYFFTKRAFPPWGGCNVSGNCKKGIKIPRHANAYAGSSKYYIFGMGVNARDLDNMQEGGNSKYEYRYNGLDDATKRFPFWIFDS